MLHTLPVHVRSREWDLPPPGSQGGQHERSRLRHRDADVRHRKRPVAGLDTLVRVLRRARPQWMPGEPGMSPASKGRNQSLWTKDVRLYPLATPERNGSRNARGGDFTTAGALYQEVFL